MQIRLIYVLKNMYLKNQSNDFCGVNNLSISVEIACVEVTGTRHIKCPVIGKGLTLNMI